MTYAIGVDAGKHVGVALLSVLANRRASCLSLKVCDPVGLGAHIDWLVKAFGATLVVIEIPDGSNYGKRPNTAALLHARGVGERLRGFCEAKGLDVLMTTATEWRSALECRGGKNEKADHAVKRMVQLRVEGLPRCASHERDAIGAALYGALRVMGERTIGQSRAAGAR